MRTNPDSSHKTKSSSQVPTYTSSSMQRPTSSGPTALLPSKDLQSRRQQRLYNTLPTNNRSDHLSQSLPNQESPGGLSGSQLSNFAASFSGTSSSSTNATGSGSLHRKVLHQQPQFFSPPTSSQQQRRGLTTNTIGKLNEAAVGSMSEMELKSIVKRQQEQLEDLNNRRYVLQRKVDSLKALNEQQTAMLLRDNRTKEIKKEHLQIIQRLKELQTIQSELDRAKRSNAKIVSELSIAKAQLVGKRAEVSPQVQYMHLLTEKLELMRLWCQQMQVDSTAAQAITLFKNIFHIESAGDRQSLLLSENANFMNQQQWLRCVPSHIISQFETMLQERSRADTKLKQIRLQHQQMAQYQMQTHSLSTDSQQHNQPQLPQSQSATSLSRSESANGNTYLDVKHGPTSSYVYSPRVLQTQRQPEAKVPSPLSARHKPGVLLPLQTAITNSNSPPLPERKHVPPQLSFLQDLTSSGGNKLGAMNSGVDNLLNSPVAADLSGQELLIRPLRPPSVVGRNGGGSHSAYASKTWSLDKNSALSLSTVSGDVTDGGPPVAPRVMRRASLLRYASNSFIRDTYFRGTRREELAKKYKESADALLQTKLMQLRHSSLNSTSSTDTSLGAINATVPPVDVPSSLEGSFDNSDESVNRVSDHSSQDSTSAFVGDVNSVSAISVPEERVEEPPDNESLVGGFGDTSQSCDLEKPSLEVNISKEEDLLLPTETDIQIDNLADDGAAGLLVSAPGIDDKPQDTTPTGEDKSPLASLASQPLKLKTAPKGILRPREVPGSGRRIRFLPLTLLLDASLVGDLEMVRHVATKVNDVSEPNEDGITALHNSICAGYDEISMFLVIQCAANVNAQELDGWTPLHCAAACGSVDMCRLLVEHGAALLLPTLEDGESALEKATNLARENGAFAGGHAACEEYLHYEVLRLWRLDSATPLYALFDHSPQQEDELPLRRNEKLELLKADIVEEPYWCMVRSLDNNREGLVPKYYVSRYPLLTEAAQIDPDSLSMP